MSALRDLLEQLRAGANPPLATVDLVSLLAWLTGSFERDKEEGRGDLPRPEDDQVLLRMVLFRLDETLFDNGTLDLQAAGLDPDQPASTRRGRFRRLASAFHPDRFPDLADWLTQRSQAVHQAYGRFKQDPEGSAFAAPPPGPAQSTGAHTVFREPRAGVRSQPIDRFAIRLRRRFGPDRFLAHKIIAALAILALLPVINLWLVPNRDLDALSPTRDEATRAEPGREHAQRATDGTLEDPGESGGAIPAPAAEPNFRIKEQGSRSKVQLPEPIPVPEPTPQVATHVSQSDVSQSDTRTSQVDTPQEASEATLAAKTRPDTEARTIASRNADRSALPSSTVAEPAAEPNSKIKEQGSRSKVQLPEPIPVPEPTPQVDTHLSQSDTRTSPVDTSQEASEATLAAKTRPDTEARTIASRNADRSALPSSTVSEPVAGPAPLPAGKLELGFFAKHPVGLLLTAFHSDLESGNLPGLVSRFAPDAQYGRLRGNRQLAQHFRELFDRAPERQVNLRVQRLERDGEYWRAEADLEILVRGSDGIEPLQAGRTVLWIGEQNGTLQIRRIEN